MRIKELSKKYIGRSCIVEQDYKTNDGDIGHESIFITDITKADWTSNDIGWYIDGNVCHIERTPWFDEKHPYWDMSIGTGAFWSEKSNSDCRLEEAEFEFLPKEVVLQRLKERIGELMGEEKTSEDNKQQSSDWKEKLKKERKKIKPKYIVKNYKSGKSFYALDVDLYFPTHNYLGPEREFRFIFTDDVEHVKDVVNFDAIYNATEKKVVYELNESFDIYRIDGEKVTEIRALIPHKIDPDYHTITGIFEFEILNIDTKEGYKWKSEYDAARKYAKSLDPFKHFHEHPLGDTGVNIII